MSDSKEPAVEVERNDGDRKEGDGSDGYGITEEQEKTLLAGEEDDNLDLDVIECFVDDFDSDMEEEFRRKDAKKVEMPEKKADEVVKKDTVEVLEFVRIVHNADESGSTTEEPLEGFEEEVAAPVEEAEDDDEDVIQIVEESVEDLLGDGKVEEPLEASVHVSDETENERILSKPLVKQVVMDMSGEECDKEDASTRQVGGEGSQKGDEDDRVETPNGSQDDSDAEQPLVIAVSVEANVGAMSGRHQEDPDVLQLKLDLQQNLGKMDYEPDDEERLERRIQIKEEPMSPVRDRLERILLDVEDIPTIVLSSDDDLSEQVVQEKKPKKAKKKSKKKSKQRSKSECSEIEAAPIDVEESLPAVISTTSSKSFLSNDCMFMDEELFKTGFRMELRKRKSATRLEESVTSPPSRKRRNPTRKSSDCRSSIGQSKSRGSIASTVSSNMSEYNVPADIPPKKTPSQKSTSRPVSTALKMKFNSLFDDCDKPEEVVPVSILVDGMPLFEKVSKKHVTAPVPPPAPHRQTMLIDALPRVGGASPAVKPGPSKSSGQKSKIEQEIMHSLENDLAMSSDDEVAPLRQKLGSVKGRSPAPSEKRKRGRAPKHHIEDYFGSSPTRDKKDETPATETASNGGGKKPQVKRRKKRSHISSGSSEDETTATESTSLAGTISTITARDGDEEQLPVAPEEVAPPKTDEMRVVLSPLTDAKIEKLSKCNTPKKPRALSKASQTELQGLSWRIELDQIDFHSEYFEKLYQLIVNGRELRNNLRPNINNNNKFEGVVLVGRDAVLPPTPPERSPQRPVGNGRARSAIEQLLFQRADEIEFESSAPVDPAARERMEQSVRSNFRIPKIAKQPSRSPQDVTSSTQHDNEQQQQHYQDNETRRSSSSGYSNDRPVAPEARHHITVGSPLRNPNRLEAPAPAIDPQPAARPVPIMRRTIRNDNVQPPAPPQPIVAPPTPAQPQPVENGFPTYGPPEQVPPPQQQYRAGNMFQPPQQQQPQLGGYTASGQELDVKPNLSALMNPANMLGTAMMNPSRFFDSLSMVYQVTMMQMMQQHMPFPAMNPAGQPSFPGPSVAPTAANMPPQPMPAQMMPRPQPTPSSSAGPRFAPDPVQSDEVSDQICQIFGCIDHLKGRCIKNPCQYSHTLPNESSLLQMLLGCAQDVVMTTYQFIVGQDSLFLRYFPVYTEVMGRRNMRHQLVDAVPHCEQSKRAFSHYRFIVDGLTINGTLTRSKAVQLVLEKHRKINFDQINVLITLMLDTGDDIPQFLQWFEQFAQVQDYHYEIPSINRLIKFCVRSSRSVDVAKLTYRLLLSVAPGKEPFVDTDALSEFVEQLMKSKLGLDLEKIRLKYRENELSGSARR
uniref:(northern house mosquito) hypothetical protein n=1 Tax=Culex pipiens TaxID=7175 RepID=A0A8D8PDJ8_CULPI